MVASIHSVLSSAQAQAQVQALNRARAQEPCQNYYGPLFYNQVGPTG